MSVCEKVPLSIFDPPVSNVNHCTALYHVMHRRSGHPESYRKRFNAAKWLSGRERGRKGHYGKKVLLVMFVPLNFSC
jgi:hypothetical protein